MTLASLQKSLALAKGTSAFTVDGAILFLAPGAIGNRRKRLKFAGTLDSNITFGIKRY